MGTDPVTHIIKTDSPVNVQIGEQGGYWFKVFNSVIDSGIWARLTPVAAKVLMVLARNVNDETRQGSGDWLAWPKISTIAELAGITERKTYTAISRLQDAGLVVVRASGRGRVSSVYQLVAPKPDRMVRFDEERRERQTCPLGQVKPDRMVRSLKERKKRSNSSSGAARRSGAQKTARRGATAPASAADVLTALTDAGISDPTRSELASTSHVTPGLVNRIAERCRERGKGAGAMVLDIRAAAAKAARDAERKRQRREAERQVLADIEQQTADMATGAQREAGLAKMAEALGRRSRGIV